TRRRTTKVPRRRPCPRPSRGAAVARQRKEADMSLPMPAPPPSDREMLLNAEIEALRGISATAKAMLRLIIRMEDSGFTSSRLEYLGAQVGIKKRQAKNVVRALAAKGHINVTRRPGRTSIIRPAGQWITLWTNQQIQA